MTRSGLSVDDERVLDQLADALISVDDVASMQVAEIKEDLFTFVAQLTAGLTSVHPTAPREGVINGPGSVYEVEIGEAMWLVREGNVWRLSRPWATRVNWNTGKVEPCLGFLVADEVRVLREGDRVWMRTVT